MHITGIDYGYDASTSVDIEFYERRLFQALGIPEDFLSHSTTSADFNAAYTRIWLDPLRRACERASRRIARKLKRMARAPK